MVIKRTNNSTTGEEKYNKAHSFFEIHQMELQLSRPIEFKVSYSLMEKICCTFSLTFLEVIHEPEQEWSGFIFQLQRKMQQVKNFGNKKRNCDF